MPSQHLDPLFSEVAKEQYAGLQLLGSATMLSRAQCDRILEIRSACLAAVEMAETLLRDKITPTDLLRDPHREVCSLVRRYDDRERRRLDERSRNVPAALLRCVFSVRWVVAAAIAGLAIGGLLFGAVLAKGHSEGREEEEAYVEATTGRVVSLDAERRAELRQRGELSGYQAAFYCWKCREWVPRMNPQQNGAPVQAPRQALSNHIPAARTMNIQSRQIGNATARIPQNAHGRPLPIAHER